MPSPRHPHRVGRRALGTDGVAARGFQHAAEAVEEEGRGDGDVHEESQRRQRSKHLGISDKLTGA